MNKKIGILGSGAVAKALGNGFIKHGYSVMLGTSNASKLADWQSQSGGQVGTFADTAEFGDIIVLAVKGYAAIDILNSIGAEKLNGKTIIDTTNPIDEKNPPVNGVLNYFTAQGDSLMEQLQKAVPNAHFVKAFNSIGAHLMVNPQFEALPTMFICGNNNDAKQEVASILTLFGFEVEDMGKVEAARAIEALCMLWCIPGFLQNQWVQAFRFMRPKTA